MSSVLVCLAVVLSSSTAALPEPAKDARGVSLEATMEGRSASLLGGQELAATWKPSASTPLRLTDGFRLNRAELPMALDQGGGMSSDTRQILALILGFFPGFGLGHLVAGDKHGFVTFLVVDLVLYAGWAILGGILHGVAWWVPGFVWLVVHIFQALDAYAQAGGERIVEILRERAVEIASGGGGRGSDGPIITTRVWSLSF
jgi:hypothetical protein